jgi:hypothetical protein
MHVRYPRTPHLPWSPGATPDDVRAGDLSGLLGREVVVTEKPDGENTTLYADGVHARSLDSAHHPSRSLGRVRGRMRGLLTALEDAGVADAHAWPRPFDTGPAGTRFAIGLGRIPLSAHKLGGIASGWLRGLGDVVVEQVDCGGVPTLH